LSTELSTNIASSPLSIIERAIEKGIDADTMSKLVDLQERMQRLNAESEFNHAMQDFQGECPPIPHNKNGHANRYSYADLPQIAAVIKPFTQKFGFSYSFDTETFEKSLVTKCTVCHVAGHSKTSSIMIAIDGTSSMSSPQKTASAMTYGRRYALCAAFGIVTADTDDDAQIVGAEKGVNPEQRPETRTAPRDKRDVDADVLDRFRALGRRWKLIREQLGLSVTNEDYGRMICTVDEKIEPQHTLKPSLWTEATFTGVENEIRKLESQASL
jgi:uncharacterized protein (DUF4415 family)